MREIRDSGKVVGADRIAVMAALNIANDLLQLRERDAGSRPNSAHVVKIIARTRRIAPCEKGQQLEL